MMENMDVVALSRIQFGATALYHFIFVPLTLGLATICAIMETIYVRTNNTAWRDAAKFWGLLFGINFAMGVATGIPMEFQFGTNWSVYSDMVGDIFGAPLAIEGLMAFFLEATFIGMWFFGWNKLSKVQHCVVGWLMALGATFSAIWILVANGFMQNPAGGALNVLTGRIEMVDFFSLILNPVAQSKFGHTITAGYVCGAVFVLSISAYYLLRGRNKNFARRSMIVASTFGVIALAANIWMGHASGDRVATYQPVKMAVLEGVCEPQTKMAGFSVFASIKENIKQGGECEVASELYIPKLIGLVTVGIWENDAKIISVQEHRKNNEQRIRNGILSYQAAAKIYDQFDQASRKYVETGEGKDVLDAFRAENAILMRNIKKAGQLSNYADQAAIDAYQKALTAGLTNEDFIEYAKLKDDYGYGLLLFKYTNNLDNVTDEMIALAVNDSIPSVAPNYWSFRIMFYLGSFMFLFMIVSYFMSRKHNLDQKRGFLWWSLFMLPVPWVVIESGWMLAEYGRQPWAIQDLLPTFFSVSNHPAMNLWISLSMFVLIYSSLIVVELYLMRKYIKLGPDGVSLDKKDTVKE